VPFVLLCCSQKILYKVVSIDLYENLRFRCMLFLMIVFGFLQDSYVRPFRTCYLFSLFNNVEKNQINVKNLYNSFTLLIFWTKALTFNLQSVEGELEHFNTEIGCQVYCLYDRM
jgi:hypothetical protein